MAVPLPGCQCSQPWRTVWPADIQAFLRKFHEQYNHAECDQLLQDPRLLVDNLENVALALLTYYHRLQLPPLRRRRLIAMDSSVTRSLVSTAAKAAAAAAEAGEDTGQITRERLQVTIANGGHWSWEGPATAAEDACDLGPPLPPFGAEERNEEARARMPKLKKLRVAHLLAEAEHLFFSYAHDNHFSLVWVDRSMYVREEHAQIDTVRLYILDSLPAGQDVIFRWFDPVERMLVAAGLIGAIGANVLSVPEDYPIQTGIWECGYVVLSAIAHVLFPGRLADARLAASMESTVEYTLTQNAVQIGSVDDLRPLLLDMCKTWLRKMGLAHRFEMPPDDPSPERLLT